MLHRLAVVVACLLTFSLHVAANAGVTWEETFSKTGEVKTTVQKTGGNKNSNKNNNNKNTSQYREKPIYIPFTVSGPAIKVAFETVGLGDRPGLKIELEQLVQRGKKEDWRRVAVIGRTRGDGKGASGLRTEPGKYRFSLRGSQTKYTIKVEEAKKSDS